ncbi:MAG: cation:proton antiporter [Lachnospiraceae bacterium]|nr:cation:proton antiporter [Lachnospiraceae bacterium]
MFLEITQKKNDTIVAKSQKRGATMGLQTLSEQELICTFIALALLLAGAYLCGTLFERIKAPRVVGEIIGGMLFGSFLFPFFPKAVAGIFNSYEGQGKVLNIFYQLGLVFLMFLSGYNTNLEIDKKNLKTIGCVFVGATFLPMLGAIPFIQLFEEEYIGTMNNSISFALVFTIGVAITSIPVISKIFFDMGVMNTTFSNTVLTVSTFQDLCLWILLNAATRIAVSGEVKLVEMLIVAFVTLGLFAIAKLVTKYVHVWKKSFQTINFYSVSFIALLLVCALLYIAGINIMYSAFLVGYIVKAVVGTEQETIAKIDGIKNFAFSFFIPIYFALVGIQLDILNNFSFLRFALFFVIAFSLEAVGTLIMLIPTDLNRVTKINFAVTMNARGGPGIVLATVAYSYGIINLEFFTVLILTTMLSSLIAGYWLRWQQKKDATIFMNLTK